MASPFSGSSGRKASMWTAGYLQQLQPQILEQLQQGKTEGLGYLGQGIEAVQGGYGQAISELGRLYGQGAQQFERGVETLQPVRDEAMKGYGMLSNALGLGGAEGNAAARGAFQAGPGYEWQKSQATEAANRRAASMGMLNSGNAQEATAQLASNLANQEWGNWIKNLQPYQTQAGTMATNQAQILQNLGQFYGDQGKATAGLYGDEAAKLAGLYGGQANIATSTAESGAQAIAGIGSQIANVGMQGMQAGQQAAQNRMSALSGGLSLAGQALGGIAGLGVAGGGTLGGNFISGLFGKS
jgi:hypothetical protein